MLRCLTLVVAAAALVGVAHAGYVPKGPPIITAAAEGDTARVQKLLASGTDANTHGKNGETPLNVAAINGQLDVVKLLLANKADVNVHGAGEWTPLMDGSGNGHLNVVTYLLDHGADINAVSKDGYSALALAAMSTKADVVSVLLKRGGDSAVALISNARETKPAAAITLLIDNGANVNAVAAGGHPKYRAGDTVLLIAAERNDVSTVSLLLARGADPNLATPAQLNMTTPLMWAAYNCNAEMARALIARGASLSAANQGGSTALALAQKGWTADMKACDGDVLALLSATP